ncbi:Ndufb8, NADH dehydrogenase 19kDa subunit [Amylocystis lapponica]|nr:Ndufb8, NADH dehydrogenase 19kDa subunit [Amylocystis lapponica]
MQTTIVTARAAAIRRVLRPNLLVPRPRTYATPTVFSHDDDPQLADYPRLPFVSRQRLPALGPYDDPQMRRNFGETMHEKEEILSMWGPDAPPVPPPTALLHFTIAVLGFVGFGTLVKFALIPSRSAIPRDYPYSGLITELGGFEDIKARPESEEEED